MQQEDTNGWKKNEVKKEEPDEPKLLSLTETKDIGKTHQSAADLVNSLVANDMK